MYHLYSFKFVNLYSVTQNVVYVGKYSIWVWEEYVIHHSWIKLLTEINYIKLIIGVVEFNYVLSHLSDTDLSISDRGVLKSPTIILDSFISPCDFISFFFNVFWFSVIWHIDLQDCMCFLGEFIPLSLCKFPLYPL